MNLQNVLKSTIISLPLALMLGCGGGGGGSSDSPASVSSFTGVFIDSAISGATYECSSGKVDITNNLGEYTCNVGDTVEFSIGGLILGSVPVSDTITPNTLFPNNPTAALNLAQFLQTLDSAGDTEDGITIDEDLVAKLSGKSFDFTDKGFDALMEAALGKELVSEVDAQKHLDDTLGRLTDTTAPIFTSASSVSVNENALSVITVVTDDESAILSLSGDDANLFTLAANVLSFNDAPDYEVDKHTFNISITAEDSAQNSAVQNLTIELLDVDETVADSTPPTITSANEITVNENTREIVTITTDEVASISLSGSDLDKFSLVGNVLSFENPLDFESDAGSYRVTIIARDIANNSSSQELLITLQNVIDTKPTLSATTSSISESTVAGAVVGNIAITDSGDSSISVINLSGEGSGNFNVSTSGEITLSNAAALDYETTTSYSLNAVAKNAAGNSESVSVRIDVVNVDDNIPVLLNATATVVENMSAAEAVGTIAISTTGDSPISAIALSGDGSDKFLVSNSGAIITASGVVLFDYETTTSYALNAVATNAAGNSASVDVTINVTNIADVAPTLQELSLEISENIAASTLIGSIGITSIGDSPISAITLSGTNSDKFTVSTTGEIRVASGVSFDYETTQTYNLKARATNAVGDSQEVNLVVSITDIDEIAPNFTTPSSVNVNENALSVLTIATDDESATLSLGGTNATEFNLVSNVLSFKDAPDYEEDVKSYSVTITARDEAGNEATQTISINVLDIDEVAPDTKEPTITSSDSLEVVENTTGTLLSITTDEVATLTLSGTDATAFNLAGSILSFKVAPDYETKSSYSVLISAEDSVGNIGTQTLTVTISDIDEIAPEFTENSFTFDINENIAYVGSLTTVDDIKEVSITLSGTDADKFFTDRIITFKSAPDYESDQHTYSLIATVKDSAGNSSSVPVTINIIDMADLAPTLKPLTITLAEDSTTTGLLGNVVLDAGDRDITGIYLSGDGSDKFRVNLDGDVSRASDASFDYESAVSYSIQVRAASESIGVMDPSPTTRLSVNITNIVDEKPVLNITAASIAENAVAGTVVGNITITDSGDSPISLISLSGEGSANFNVSTSGEITLSNAAALDYETSIAYSLNAVATNAAGNSESVALSINVTDVNDNSPLFTSANSISVDENQANVITLSASDADNATEFIYSLVVGADSVNFEINSGVVTFLSSSLPDYETKSFYTFSVKVSDGLNHSTQTIGVNILDVHELMQHNGFGYDTVVSPTTGRTWLDRNLGATDECSSAEDANCFGDYYQWGRGTDGHEKTDSTYVVALANDIESIGSDFYEMSGFDWTTADEDGHLRAKKWSKSDGSSICPVGYRVPTLDEYDLEKSDIAFFNLANGGSRFRSNVGGDSYRMWTLSSNSERTGAYQMYNSSSNAMVSKTDQRDNGNSVRCIEDNSGIIILSNLNYVAEGDATAINLLAVNTDGSESLTYTIKEGLDSGSFTIDTSTGVVSFNEVPDYESGKIEYSFVVEVTDATDTAEKNRCNHG